MTRHCSALSSRVRFINRNSVHAQVLDLGSDPGPGFSSSSSAGSLTVTLAKVSAVSVSVIWLVEASHLLHRRTPAPPEARKRLMEQAFVSLVLSPTNVLLLTAPPGPCSFCYSSLVKNGVKPSRLTT